MISSAGRLATMGLVGGTAVGTAVAKPKTQKGEHNLNKFQTTIGLGALAATPFLVKEAVKANPRGTVKLAQHTGAAIEKGAEYAVKYGKKGLEYIKKAANSENGAKVISNVKYAVNKFKHSKIGKQIINSFSKFKQIVGSNATVQKVVVKAEEALKNFAKAPATKKGKIGLIAAGVALLAYAGIKTITNFYKKEGAIDQKYKDMQVMNNILS